jgi:hypothetical protein
VVALAVFALSVSLPDLRRVWQPIGEFGVGTDFDGVVNFIQSRSSAEKAGIKLGDRYDVTSTRPEYRYNLLLNTTYLPGQTVTAGIVRGGQLRSVTLTSDPESMDAPKQALIIGRELVMLLFVGVGASLVLLQPSVSTWAFYLFCVGLNGAPASVVFGWLTLPWNWALGILYSGLQLAGLLGVTVFASIFLHEQDTGWRAAMYRFAPLAWLVMFGLQMFVAWGSGWFGWRVGPAGTAAVILEAAISAVALYALVSTYVSARGADRQRIRWVVLGFGIALLAIVANVIIGIYFAAWPYWVHATLAIAYGVVPLTVAYAVIKHRIIDVSFVVSRALVYALLTSLLVGVFSLMDWFFTDYLRNARLGTVAEVGAVLAFGFSFNGLHKRLDSLIDATFFRQRHRAEIRLARAAAALPLVSTTQAVAHFLVREPADAVSLASSALFRRDRDGVYSREEAMGWDANDLTGLDSTDEPLLALALAEAGPLLLYDYTWRTEGVPSGVARPVLALPIIVRRELAAIAFYGSHVHGEALDPDEVKAIAGLATGAAAAYDHLEAEEMRRKVESLEKEMDSMRAQLSETRTQPA